MFRIKKPAPLGLAKILPIRGLVARPRVLGRIDKGLDQHRSIPIDPQPIIADLLGGQREGMTCKMRRLDPGEN